MLTEGEKLGRRRTARGSATVWRRLGIAAAIAALPLAAADAASAQRIRTASWCSPRTRPSGAAEGVAALQASAPPEATFDVSADAGKFTDAGLAPYKAVVFLNTTGDVLDAAQADGVREVLQGRGRLPRRRLGDRDRARLAFFTDILGTRSHRRRRAPAQATIKVADRGHAAAARMLPEYWHAHRPLVQLHRQRPRRLARDRDGRREDLHGRQHDGAADAQHRPSRRLVQGLPGRPLLLHRASATPPRLRRGATSASTSAARSQWAAGKADPVYSDCGATVLANYQQTKISAPPNLNEPIGFDQLPDGRVIQTARARPGAPARPGHGQTSQIIANIPVYTNSEDGLYGPRGRQRLRHQQVGLPVLRAADRPHQQVRRHDRPT